MGGNRRCLAARAAGPMALALAVVVGATSLGPAPPASATTAAPPMWTAALDGGVVTVGHTPFLGGRGGAQQPPVIAVVATPSGHGYWLATIDGQVFAFGDAPWRGSLRGLHLSQPIIAMARTPSGHGYWLVGIDGGVFAFGDAVFHGGLGGIHLNGRITAIMPTPSGRGYWLVAADGGVFAFGDAVFRGGLGGTTGGAPIATAALTHTGRGYWLLRRDGRVAAFGDAVARGNAPAATAPAVAIVPTQSGAGYWIGRSDGGIVRFGDAAPVAVPVAHYNAPFVGFTTPWAASAGYGLTYFDILASLFSNGPTWVGPHQVALTFDDGPSAYTLPMLATLQRFGVPATFFTVGYEAVARPDLILAEARAGMAIGDHSWDHPNFLRLTAAQIHDQLARTQNMLQHILGHHIQCFRSPYGNTNATVVAEGAKLGMTQVLWNVNPSDYLRPGASTIAARVLSTATGHGIVVGMHDGGGDRSQTVAALPEIIRGLQARGYHFVRLCN